MTIKAQVLLSVSEENGALYLYSNGRTCEASGPDMIWATLKRKTDHRGSFYFTQKSFWACTSS